VVQPVRVEVALALLAFVCIGLTDFVRKKASLEGAHPLGYLLVESLVVMAVLSLSSLVFEGFGKRLWDASIPYALLSGLAISLGLIALMSGLRIGQGSVVIPISRLGLALAATLSILFFGETVTWTKILGVAFAVVAVLLLSS
jgi:transporter family protein